MNRLSGVRYLLLVAIGWAPVMHTATAREVYKWTGPDGSTHYTEDAPRSDVASLEVLQVTGYQSAPASENPADTADSSATWQKTLETARQLQADRLAREQLRLEREALRQREREAQAQAQQQQFGETAPSYFIPYYPYQPRYKPNPQRPRPPQHGPGWNPPPQGYPGRPPPMQQARDPRRPPGGWTYRVQRPPATVPDLSNR
jgi:serine/threonine protein kinase, bacterial